MPVVSTIVLLGILQVLFNISIISFHPGVAGIPFIFSSRRPNLHQLHQQSDDPQKMTSTRVKRWLYSTMVGSNGGEEGEEGQEEAGGRKLSPIIFLPGTGGSQLEARMGSFHSPPEGCPRQTSWYRLWLDVMYIFSGDLNCWVDAMKLRYNTTSRKSTDAPGLQTRVPNFGVTDSIEYIDPSWVAWAAGNVGAYAAPFMESLQGWGYLRNKNLRGAPYDFRYAPHSLESFYRSLKYLIERTYADNGNTRVSLVAHSMGGLVALYFLNRQPQAWKDHYIHRFISMNTPWQGTVVATQAMVSGINWEQENVDPWLIREQQRSQESAALLLPSKKFWPRKTVIVSTPSRNYTVKELYNVFFDDIEFPIAREMAKNVQTADYEQENPGVKMYCLYTYGQPTPETLMYGDGLSNEKYPARVINGDGDGSVNYRSLRGCRNLRFTAGRKRWRPKHRVYLRGFKGPGHDGIFTDERVLEKLKHILAINRRH